jgi:hypothetical protein
LRTGAARITQKAENQQHCAGNKTAAIEEAAQHSPLRCIAIILQWNYMCVYEEDYSGAKL